MMIRSFALVYCALLSLSVVLEAQEVCGPCFAARCPRNYECVNQFCQRTTNDECVDKNAPGKASDCPQRVKLCNDNLFFDFMTDQCPKTCGRCGQKASKNYGNRRR